MGLRKLFKTDERVENDGVVLDYGDTRIRIARAGGANKRYAKLLDKMTKPIRRAIAAGTLDNERAMEILMEAYAKTVVLGWETRADDQWVPGISPADAGVDGKNLLPLTPENCLLVFKNLPDLFQDVRQQAESISLFRAELDEAAAGN